MTEAELDVLRALRGLRVGDVVCDERGSSRATGVVQSVINDVVVVRWGIGARAHSYRSFYLRLVSPAGDE